MLLEGRDFVCSGETGIYLCSPQAAGGRDVYWGLQSRLQSLGAQLPKVDGYVGPSTVLALQPVLSRLSRTAPLPPELTPIVSAPSARDAIRQTAAYARQACIYIDYVLAKYPHALSATPAPLPLSASGLTFPTKPLLYALGAGAVVGASVWVTHKVRQRSAGIEDGRRFLPPDLDDDDSDDDEG